MKVSATKESITIDNTPITFEDYIGVVEYFNTVEYLVKPERFIHYTSVQCFQAMLKPYAEEEKDYVLLFPSNAQFLNDSSEFKTGYNLVKSKYGLLASEHNISGNLLLRDDAFTVSFCGEEDLLSQWKYYGKSSGVAIEFDFSDDPCNFLWCMIKPDGKKEWAYDVALALELSPRAVIYGKARQGEVFKKIMEWIKDQIDDINSSQRSAIINGFIPFCKDISFSEEKESRLLFYPINQNGPLNAIKTPQKYRSTEVKIIPQFECRLSYRKTRSKEQSPIPIKNIMIGPGYNQTVVFNSVIDMLERGIGSRGSIGYISDEMIKKLKDSNQDRVEYDDIVSGRETINNNKLCVVTKIKKTRMDWEKMDIIDKLEYVTYKTSVGITVQMSATPFRA